MMKNIGSLECNSFKMGLRDGFPIFMGYLSVSFAFGIFAVGLELSVLEALFISMFNMTSAGQLAAAPIIAGGGSLFELAMTQLVINARYTLMSVSMSQKFGSSVRLTDRFLIAFGNTDEIFAVSTSKGMPVGSKYLFGLILLPYLGWSGGTLLGAAAGSILPSSVISALGIAIYAMFIAIVIPGARERGGTALAVASAIALSCLFYYVPVLNKIPSGFAIIICAVSVSALFALLMPIKAEEGLADE